jgi:hypothetical protein
MHSSDLEDDQGRGVLCLVVIARKGTGGGICRCEDGLDAFCFACSMLDAFGFLLQPFLKSGGQLLLPM